jgi:hypothetical protein
MFNARIKMHNFHPRKPHYCIEYRVQYRTHLSMSFICNIAYIMKDKENSAMISCIMVSLGFTLNCGVLYDYRQHSFAPTNIRHVQESVTNNLNFMDISFMCKIFGLQDSIKILLLWDMVPCHLLHTKLYGIKPKMTNFMVFIMCMLLQTI